jgi:hypothetical protein
LVTSGPQIWKTRFIALRYIIRERSNVEYELANLMPMVNAVTKRYPEEISTREQLFPAQRT